ncbi:hypothetical protein TRE132_50730 [Pseudomonas chlororaphis subsp. aurantiaca]|nr:hypothetical protein TRE132_50730 [Pseudomonas chlororaphis subsp. aurantiaca]
MIGFTSLKRLLLATATLGFAAHAAAVEPALKLDVYNPGTAAIFPVTSVLVSGKKEAILVDAQFGKSQAEQLVEKIRASGKQLTTIYISHGDPDYYFGLDTITQAFPRPRSWRRSRPSSTSRPRSTASSRSGARKWAPTCRPRPLCRACSRATA